MAYMSQDRKASIAPVVKKILQKYGVKGTLSVHNHSTLVLNVKAGKIDFIKNFNETADRLAGNRFTPATDSIDVNPYWYHEHFGGVAKNFLREVIQAMNAGNHDNSDIQTDYFDVGWYISVKIGRWNRPYELIS